MIELYSELIVQSYISILKDLLTSRLNQTYDVSKIDVKRVKELTKKELDRILKRDGLMNINTRIIDRYIDLELNEDENIVDILSSDIDTIKMFLEEDLRRRLN